MEHWKQVQEFIPSSEEILHSSKGSISHTLCLAQIDGSAWGAPAHPQRGAGSAQSNPRMCLTFTIPHVPPQLLQAGWTTAMGLFWRASSSPTAPSTAEGEHGWLVEFQPWNGFKTQREWPSGGAQDEVIHSGVFLAGGGSTSVFLKGKEQGLSPCSRGWWHIQPAPLDPLLSLQLQET